MLSTHKQHISATWGSQKIPTLPVMLTVLFISFIRTQLIILIFLTTPWRQHNVHALGWLGHKFMRSKKISLSLSAESMKDRSYPIPIYKVKLAEGEGWTRETNTRTWMNRPVRCKNTRQRGTFFFPSSICSNQCCWTHCQPTSQPVHWENSCYYRWSVHPVVSSPAFIILASMIQLPATDSQAYNCR